MLIKLKMTRTELSAMAGVVHDTYMQVHPPAHDHVAIADRIALITHWYTLVRAKERLLTKPADKAYQVSMTPWQYIALLRYADIDSEQSPYAASVLRSVLAEGDQQMREINHQLNRKP